MKKLILASLVVPLCLAAKPVYDKERQMWTYESDDPENPKVALINERSLERRIAAIEAARRSALSKTNFINVVVTPDTPWGGAKTKTYSKMKCVLKLTQMGVWEQVKQWIIAQGLYDVYLAAQDFSEDNPYFVQGLATFKEMLGLSDEQIRAVLRDCEADK